MIDDHQQTETGEPVGKRNASMVDGPNLASPRCRKHHPVPLEVRSTARLAEIVQQGAGHGPGQAPLVVAKWLLRRNWIVGQNARQLGDKPGQVFFLRRQPIDFLALVLNALAPIEDKIDTLMTRRNAEEADDVQVAIAQATEEVKGKTDQLEKLIMPLLVNLLKTADKEYIHWPNRETQVKSTIDKVLAITRG